MIDGRGGFFDTLDLETDVGSIVWSNQTPSGGDIHLQNFETIRLFGGRVNGNIDASAATANTTFRLGSGTVTGNVIGSNF